MCPPEIELGLAVAREVEKQASRVEQQWAMRLERSRYDARKAEQRYKAIDPDNRLVARNLEHEWNERLWEVEELEREQAEVSAREHLQPNDNDRRAILSMVPDLARVWCAPTTEHADRKNLNRMLVREISVSLVEIPRRATCVKILWQTGQVSELVVARPSKGEAVTTPPALIERVRDLAATATALLKTNPTGPYSTFRTSSNRDKNRRSQNASVEAASLPNETTVTEADRSRAMAGLGDPVTPVENLPGVVPSKSANDGADTQTLSAPRKPRAA